VFRFSPRIVFRRVDVAPLAQAPPVSAALPRGASLTPGMQIIRGSARMNADTNQE